MVILDHLPTPSCPRGYWMPPKKISDAKKKCIIKFLVEQIFREANISSHGYVNYQEFVKIVCAPVPDYYWCHEET